MSSPEYVRRWTDRARNRYLVTLYRGGLSGQAVRLTRGVLRLTRSFSPTSGKEQYVPPPDEMRPMATRKRGKE